MNLKALHHLFLLGHVSNAGGHVLQTHSLCFCVALLTCGIDNLSYFFVYLLEDFNAVGVAEPYPEIILVIQMNRFLIKLKSSIIACKSVFVLRDVRLVKVIVRNRPYQVKAAI
jgi:hypothetical protein